MRTLQKYFRVPIYEAGVHIFIADDIRKHRTNWDKTFGPSSHLPPSLSGLCDNDGKGTFGVWFQPPWHKDINTVSHEIFHLTHRIGDWRSTNFDHNHHESSALLHGWLCEKIMAIINQYIG